MPEQVAVVGRLLVVTQDFRGGTGRHFAGVLRRLIDRGWRVEVICQGGVDLAMAAGIPLTLGPRPSPLHHFPIAQVRCYRQVAKRVASFKPDVVHSFFFWSIVYGRLLKLRGRITHLVENREDQGFSWTPSTYAALRRTAHVPDRVVCVAEAVRAVVLQREGLSATQVQVVRNGVEPIVSSASRAQGRRDLGLGEADLVVGMVANLSLAVKGVEYFIDAMPRILGSVPQARFVIFGDGGLRPGLEGRARLLGVRDQVLFAGYRGDVARFYPAFDVSVLTSLSEGLSITLLESMQHGVPVVVTDVGGNPEVVLDGINGFLVPPRAVERFAERVVHLLSSPDLRRRIGEAGRRRVAVEFATDNVAERYANLYCQLLHPTRSGA